MGETGQAQMTGLQSFLEEAIKKYVTESPLNRLKDIDGTTMWEEPLVGFADGDDPLFEQYKTVVGEFHLRPREALALHEKAAEAGLARSPQVGIVSWSLPVAKETKLGMRRMTEGPTLRWNHTRFQGEDFNDTLRRHVVSVLEEKGFLAVAPLLTSAYKTYELPNGRASNWSERHAAFAAGLGTFSLTDALITAKGMAHRVGSVVVNAAFVPTQRNYTHHLEYCPYPKDGSCGVCIERCPAGALGPNGHDKIKCREFLNNQSKEWLKKPGFIGHYAGCGLCQTKVPCESKIPRHTGVKQPVRISSGR